MRQDDRNEAVGRLHPAIAKRTMGPRGRLGQQRVMRMHRPEPPVQEPPSTPVPPEKEPDDEEPVRDPDPHAPARDPDEGPRPPMQVQRAQEASR